MDWINTLISAVIGALVGGVLGVIIARIWWSRALRDEITSGYDAPKTNDIVYLKHNFLTRNGSLGTCSFHMSRPIHEKRCLYHPEIPSNEIVQDDTWMKPQA